MEEKIEYTETTNYAPIITADLQYGNNFEIDLIIEHLHKLIDEIKYDIKGE